MTNPLSSLPSVSMMDFRKSPGRVVDQVTYLKQTLVIKKAGKPTVGIVPIHELLAIQRQREAAKAQFWQITQAVHERLADVDPEELQREIDEAIAQVRVGHTD